MSIRLADVLPAPLVGLAVDSEVWQRELFFEAALRYLIKAPSGRGKSTLLHILFGLRTDYSGEVECFGKLISSYSADDKARLRARQLSMIFQDLRLFPKLNVRENLLLKAKLTQHKTEKQLREECEQLGIGGQWLQPCEQLSYGQRQRVAIIRALAQPFELLLMDEPFAHLDRLNIGLAAQLINQECSRQGSGWLLVTLGDDYQIPYDRTLML